MRRHLLFGAMVLALAACSREPAPEAPAPDAAAPEATSFSAGAPPTTPAAFTEGGPLGSGCAPGGDTLPDGAWLGHVRAWDAGGVELDLVCMYTGAAATREANARGEESPPPNDFIIVNDNTATRRVIVAPGSPAFRFTDVGGRIDLERTLYAEWIVGPRVYQPCPGEWCLAWVFVNDGRATEVMRQYIP